MPLSLYTTGDNSHTLFNSELNETYHSRNGAMEESEYVFIQQGLEMANKFTNEIHLLEIGFGTGLNAILTLIRSALLKATCYYHSLETNPLPAELIDQLNYSNFLPENFNHYFSKLHSCEWNQPNKICKEFTLVKIQESLHSYQTNNRYNLVYFDAFGPEKQPDMWQLCVFEQLFDFMVSGGILVTYSAKGDVRRWLKQAGFNVDILPGPPKKRHMLRAVKP